MTKGTVFITGATGFIGAQVASTILQAGYKVKLSIRRESQAESLRNIFSDFVDNLDFVVVPDITVADAFTTALHGADYVIHLASPLPGTGQDLLGPAVKGTVSILESASKVASIKKVVITASVVSLIPLGADPGSLVVKEDISREKLLFDHSIVPSLDPMAQYAASKLASYTAALDYIATNKPHYSVVTLHPIFVFGSNILQTKPDELSGTNAMLFGSLYAEKPLFAPFSGVHVLDVAETHLRALDIPDAPVESFLLAAKQRSWDEVLDYVEQTFPGAGFKLQRGDKTPSHWNVDTSRAERLLGFKQWREMEVMVKDVVGQQLSLRAA